MYAERRDLSKVLYTISSITQDIVGGIQKNIETVLFHFLLYFFKPQVPSKTNLVSIIIATAILLSTVNYLIIPLEGGQFLMLANISVSTARKLQQFQNSIRIVRNITHNKNVLHKTLGLPTMGDFIIPRYIYFFDLQFLTSLLFRTLTPTGPGHKGGKLMVKASGQTRLDQTEDN